MCNLCSEKNTVTITKKTFIMLFNNEGKMGRLGEGLAETSAFL